MGLSDHRRVEAQLTTADDDTTGEILLDAVGALTKAAGELPPGERINQPALDYLATGVAAGMMLPDPADPQLRTVRVVSEKRG